MVKKTTEVATTESTQVAVQSAEELAIMAEMSADAGAGFEEAGMASYAIPFISILQSGSPQCKKSDGAYIEEAEEGFFINSVSNEVIDGEEGIHVIPFYFAQRFIAWGLREKGGGFKGEFKPSDPIVNQTERDDKGRDIIKTLPDCQLVDTRVHYVLLATSNGWVPAVLSLSSTQVKKSKQWMSRMRSMQIKNAQGQMVDAPMASHIWHLTTVAESNDKGSWFGLKVGSALPNTDVPAYRKAMELKKQVMEGTASAQYEEPASKSEEDNF
jgi:hypothetical protein